MQARSIVQQSFSRFQRVLRRHEEPQLIHLTMLDEVASESQVAFVDGVEAAAVETGGHGE